jgi:DNA-binding LacI/PurR family transcriptional regulator
MERGARVRLVDVARAAEVSLSAASVALNGRPGVSEPTRAKVQAVARKLGYVADASAASMRSGRTKIIGYVAEVVPPRQLTSLATAAAEVGHLLVVAPPSGVAFLARRGIDGLVVSGSDKAATAWAKTGRPLVVVGEGRLPRGATRVPDGDGAGKLAVAAIVEPG